MLFGLGKSVMSYLDNSPALLERRIASAFADSQLNVYSLEALCANLDDDESRDETGAFLNLRWQDVRPSLWRSNYGALYFFTDPAFRHFLPSLMISSLSRLDEVHLAVQTIILSLVARGNRRLDDWNCKRWLGLTVDQLSIVNDWLNYLKKPIGEYEFAGECDAAILHLQHLLDLYQNRMSRRK
jgi:hypothetical protein